jgi:hypothetical protein
MQQEFLQSGANDDWPIVFHVYEAGRFGALDARVNLGR